MSTTYWRKRLKVGDNNNTGTAPVSLTVYAGAKEPLVQLTIGSVYTSLNKQESQELARELLRAWLNEELTEAEEV